MNKRLNNKVAIITGSSSGIGRACAEMFAKEGANVVVNDNGAREGLGESIVNRIIKAGGVASFCLADVTRSDDLKNLIEFAVDKYGKIDILMNNAMANGLNGEALVVKDTQWDKMVSLSIKAAWLASNYAIPYMIKEGGGSIINTSSVHGMLAGRNVIPYATVKAGLINMARQIANDYGPYNIRANALCPGRILTEAKEMFLKNSPEERRRQNDVYPLGRPGTMEDIAFAALFLASDESSFISGIHLPVDGGLTCQLADQVALRVEKGINKELSLSSS